MCIVWLLRLEIRRVQRPCELPGVRGSVTLCPETDGAYETLDLRVVEGQFFAASDDVSYVLETGL
jgi:hypothetical protein